MSSQLQSSKGDYLEQVTREALGFLTFLDKHELVGDNANEAFCEEFEYRCGDSGYGYDGPICRESIKSFSENTRSARDCAEEHFEEYEEGDSREALIVGFTCYLAVRSDIADRMAVLRPEIFGD